MIFVCVHIFQKFLKPRHFLLKAPFLLGAIMALPFWLMKLLLVLKSDMLHTLVSASAPPFSPELGFFNYLDEKRSFVVL